MSHQIVRGEEGRDTRGEWRPEGNVKLPPIYDWPMRPARVLRWLFVYDGYILPWNVFYVAIATFIWWYLTPPIETMRTLDWAWSLQIFLRNVALIVAFTGALHLRLYVQRAQGTLFKYNSHWPDKPNNDFLFGKQIWDNIFWSVASGATIWSCYEILMMWGFANQVFPFSNLAWLITNPWYFMMILLMIPFWRIFHFYWIHRLIHWKPLYDRVHYLHHKNVNIGPWSGLAMHPVEHVLYFSSVLIHIIVPSHPVHVLFSLVQGGLGPAPGHAGFDEFVVTDGVTIPAHNYMHYLHHRYHNVNFGEGLVPMDKWFGSLHDGSDEAHAAMRNRRIQRD
ncbi:MAG: sterol desaturase family protein [Burkholderiales bacterium]|nr:sterol desaturase family protein [Burkholderiales bacterium]